MDALKAMLFDFLGLIALFMLGFFALIALGLFLNIRRERARLTKAHGEHAGVAFDELLKAFPLARGMRFLMFLVRPALWRADTKAELSSIAKRLGPTNSHLG